MPCVRSAACGSSDCPATAHRQRLLAGELHPPTSLPNHVRQAVSHLSGATHDATSGVRRLGCLVAAVAIAALTPLSAATAPRSDDCMSAHDLARVEIGQGQRVASVPRARPAKGDPNVVGTPLIVGMPV